MSGLGSTSNDVYQDQNYWEQRYEDGDSFEWCCNLTDYVHLLEPFLTKESRILILGCGNSTMSADLYDRGYTNITNIDYSANVIEKMSEKYVRLKGMTWLRMDMFGLHFPDCQFDCVIEKCTFEVLFVKEKDPWNTSDETMGKFGKVLTEVSRVLRPGGHLFSVSFTQPHFRLPLLKKLYPDWKINYSTFGSTFHYFFYECTKPPGPGNFRETSDTEKR